MQQTLIGPPRTSLQVFQMLPEGTLSEVINNQFYMSPSPKGKHQRLLRNTFRALDKYVEEVKIGEVFFAPFDVYLDEEANAVQPDLIFISNENLHIVSDDDVIHGIPDLIIEILSDGNQHHDKKTKKELYEKFGVKEYWIIDPSTKLAIGYRLVGIRYQEVENAKMGLINSALLGTTLHF